MQLLKHIFSSQLLFHWFSLVCHQIELVSGYGVYISRIHLDSALDTCGGQATHLVRKLLICFFSPNELATSSAKGSRKYPALDQTILAAIINKFELQILLCFECFQLLVLLIVEFVTMKYPNTPRSLLIDAVNDKCGSYRRRK